MKPFIIFSLSISMSSVLLAQPDEINLEDIERSILQTKQKESFTLRQRLIEAARTPQSAERFFLTSVRDGIFRANDASPEFASWQRELSGRVPGSVLGHAIQWELRYAALCLADKEQMPKSELLQAWINFVRGLAADASKLKGADGALLDGSLSEPLLKALRLDHPFGAAPFETPVLMLEMVFDEHIMPLCDSPEKLAAAHDELARHMTTVADNLMPDGELKVFREETCPRLAWKKLQGLAMHDHILSTEERTAMLKFIVSNSQHPQSLEWVQSLKGVGDSSSNDRPLAETP